MGMTSRRGRRVLLVLAGLALTASIAPPIVAAAPTVEETTGTIGYVGCSNTKNTVAGAHAVGESRFWPEMRYAGGVITNWRDELRNPRKRYWDNFQYQVDLDPPSVIWIQACIRADDTNRDVYDSMIAVIEEVRLRVPDVPIYLSPMNGFIAPHWCVITGEDGIERGTLLGQKVIRAGYALQGPILPELLSAFEPVSEGATRENNEVERDGCHPNELIGEPKLGAALNAFPAFRP